jgi:signal transduction histidine kinase
MPADRAYLQLYEPSLAAMRVIAVATASECSKLDILTPLSSEARGIVLRRQANPAEEPDAILEYPENYSTTAQEMLRFYKLEPTSLMLMPLTTKGQVLGGLVVMSEGAERFSEEHARLLLLLKEPFVVAMSNALRHREVIRLDEEAEQIQAARMESLRQLVAGVAHQINNPVGTILSNNDVSSRAIDRIRERITGKYSQEIKEDKQLASAFDVLERMNKTSRAASNRIAEMVTNLQGFVRLDEAEWQIADIREGIDSVVALMESEFSDGIKVTRDYGDVPRIFCSPSSLNQVFMSLLKNASEAIEGEGQISIRTSAQNEHVKIEINDTGKGIPAGDIDKIFDPGFTTKGVKVGVGLGLSICHKIIVDEHEGRVDVSSGPDSGTTFTITLPSVMTEKTQ